MASHALVRRSVAERLLPISDPTVPLNVGLLQVALPAGVALTTAKGAGQRRMQAARRAAGLTGVDVAVSDPAALQVGTATYFASGCLVRTWGPEERIEIGAYCSFADDIAVLHPGSPPRDRDGRRVIVPIRGAHHMQSASNYPISVLAPEAEYAAQRPADVEPSPPLVIGNDV